MQSSANLSNIGFKWQKHLYQKKNVETKQIKVNLLIFDKSANISVAYDYI